VGWIQACEAVGADTADGRKSLLSGLLAAQSNGLCDISTNPGRNKMPVSDEYLTYVLDQLGRVGHVRSKRMFGGVGLYVRGLFFALIADDVLYFKVGDSNRSDYEAAGMEPFQPFPDKSAVMQYYEVPIDVLEDEETLQEWAEKAVHVAEEKEGKQR
jgi:DNA transformation protein